MQSSTLQKMANLCICTVNAVFATKLQFYSEPCG